MNHFDSISLSGRVFTFGSTIHRNVNPLLYRDKTPDQQHNSLKTNNTLDPTNLTVKFCYKNNFISTIFVSSNCSHISNGPQFKYFVGFFFIKYQCNHLNSWRNDSGKHTYFWVWWHLSLYSYTSCDLFRTHCQIRLWLSKCRIVTSILSYRFHAKRTENQFDAIPLKFLEQICFCCC